MIRNSVRIGDRQIGDGAPCCVIAEAGVNHNGSLELAHRLIDEARTAGADAIKFQSFVTEELITAKAVKAAYQVETTGPADSQYAMLKALELDAAAHAQLKTHCDRIGLLYLCTPYDAGSVDMLDRLDVAAYKVASTDTTNLPMLRHVASTRRPILLSTGMSTADEVTEAVRTLREGGAGDRFILLQCTSEYPAPIEDVNLRAIQTMADAYRCPVGFSDHSEGLDASAWAVAAGACVIEKHFTTDRGLPGPDHRASLEPGDLAELVRLVRRVEVALGDGRKRPMPSELKNKAVMQKSVVARRAMAAGHVMTADDLTCKRPATGLPPSSLERMIGQRLRVAVAADQILQHEDVEWSRSGPA